MAPRDPLTDGAEHEPGLALFAADPTLVAIIRQLPCGFGVAEAPSGRLLYHNEEANRLLRHPMLSATDFAGYARYGAVHADGTPYAAREYPLTRALFGETVDQEEMLYVRGDGTMTVLAVSAAPVRDAQGVVVHAVCTFHDVAERRRGEDALRLANAQTRAALERAERANTARARLLAAVSHDLRQPVQAVRSLLNLLRARLGEGDASALAELAQGAVAAAEVMLTDLLDLAKLETGRVTVTPTRFVADDVVAQVAAEMKAQAAEAGIAVRHVRCSAAVLADREMLARILRNYTSNALKYAPGGRVLIGCRRKPGRLRMFVHDDGPGIDPDQQGAIFEEFYQIGRASFDSARGLGIGLATVRRLAALTGGRVGVQSAPGRGAAFWVELPLAPG